MRIREAVDQVFVFLERNRVRFTTLLVLFLVCEDLWEGIRPHNLYSLRDPMGLTGLMLVLAGVFLRSWAAGMIHKGEQLSTRGPYSLTRHPLYIGSLLMAIGFCLIIGDGENILIVPLAGLLLYFPTIRKEERELGQKFGAEWRNYAQKTGLLMPKRISAVAFSRWSLPQWLKNREYRALASSLIALLVLGLLHELPFSASFLLERIAG